MSFANDEMHVVWASPTYGYEGLPEVFYNHAFVGATNDAIPPLVTVSAPVSGAVLPVGSFAEINWTATDYVGVSTIAVDYTTNGGYSWAPIAVGQSNTGAFAWTVPNCGTNLGLVRVTAYDAAFNAGYGYSASFRVADLAPPAVSILWPTNGSSLNGNSIVTLLWSATDNVAITNVYLELSLNNGASWSALTNDAANSGASSWFVPNVATTTLLIRATAKDQVGLTASATSAQPLTILVQKHIADYSAQPIPAKHRSECSVLIPDSALGERGHRW